MVGYLDSCEAVRDYWKIFVSASFRDCFRWVGKLQVGTLIRVLYQPQKA